MDLGAGSIFLPGRGRPPKRDQQMDQVGAKQCTEGTTDAAFCHQSTLEPGNDRETNSYHRNTNGESSGEQAGKQ